MLVEIKIAFGSRAVGTICDRVFTYRTYGTGKKYRYLFLPSYCTYGTKPLQYRLGFKLGTNSVDILVLTLRRIIPM